MDGRGGRRHGRRRDVLWGEEALIALDVIREAGLPSVITLSIHRAPEVREGWSPEETCRRLADAGADVVGVNCIRGPKTMLPLLGAIRAAVDCHVAALPVPYRTTRGRAELPVADRRRVRLRAAGRPPVPDRARSAAHEPLRDRGVRPEAYALGASYLGVCCGNAPHHTRSMAEALGRAPPASRFSPDMTKHAFLGTDAKLKDHNLAYAKEL